MNRTARATTLLALLVCACAEETPPKPQSTSSAELAPSLLAPPTVAMPMSSIRTTSPAIELRTLDSQVVAAEKRFEKEKGSVESRMQLAGTLLLRFKVTAKLTDFSKAIELATITLPAKPSVDELLLVAQGLAASHEFSAALKLLEQAKAMGDKLKANDIDARLYGVLYGLGRYDEALTIAEGAARLHPTATAFADHAAVLASMGARDQAEALFLQAENKYRGVSPFFIAQLYFDRGSMFEKTGDLTNATALYRAANKRLPQHVHVATHLAPLLAPSEGIALLEPLAQDGEDPDVFAQLGVLKNIASPKSGDADIEKAKARYDVAMAKHPNAFADHAGWFWLNVGGDPKKALDAAKRNLANRQTADAYELVLAAAEESKDVALSCEARTAAQALKWKTPRLESRLATLTIDCPATAPK